MYSLDTPVKNISRIGQVTAGRLKKLGIERASDLLFYYPFRYDDFSQVLKTSQLRPGIQASISGRIDLIQNKRSQVKRKIITEAMITDEEGSIKAIWFNQPFLTKTLRIGEYVFLSGKVDYDYYGIQMTNPSYEKIGMGKETIHTARLVPVYSVTENLTQKQIRTLISIIIELADNIKEWLPDELMGKYKFLPITKALREIHFPTSHDYLKKARERLKFDELFLMQMEAQMLKYNLKQKKASKLEFKQPQIKEFVDSLPFKLTDAQRKAAWEIFQDLEKEKPMNRLLEGDVGSGKTVVAAMAMLDTALNGKQAVIMAPTEILAAQHFKGLSKLLKDIHIGLITRSERYISKEEKKINKNEMIDIIKEGRVSIVVGTHALIQENIEFKDLALAIIDEQHRFGVEQRKMLRDKSGDTDNMPHFLSMTATPIPRSLVLTIYGELDLSILDQMPVGRKPIITKAVRAENREKAYEFIRKQINMGRQAFVICPLIDPSDKLGFKSVTEEYKKLNDEIFKEFDMGILHGKLKAKEKDEIMQKFLKNEIKILVSTSVIEVGVDVPNATVMMIEGADRFGLAQLHQFRGRVGRSVYQSYCFLFSESNSHASMERLAALEKSNNGFELAEKDLEIRGPGQVYGVQQSGIPELKIAMLSDYDIIKRAKNDAEELMNIDPTLQKWPELKNKIGNIVKKVHLE